MLNLHLLLFKGKALWKFFSFLQHFFFTGLWIQFDLFIRKDWLWVIFSVRKFHIESSRPQYSYVMSFSNGRSHTSYHVTWMIAETCASNTLLDNTILQLMSRKKYTIQKTSQERARFEQQIILNYFLLRPQLSVANVISINYL